MTLRFRRNHWARKWRQRHTRLAAARRLRRGNDHHGSVVLAVFSDEVVDGLVHLGCEIALELGLTEHTVRNYIFQIFDKLGVSTRVGLVLYALGEPVINERPAAH